MSMKYSVVIPHKDSLQWLFRCVASIPIREDLEVIVVDDNSSLAETDWTDFRKEFSHVRLFLTHEAKGAGYARNIGLSYAQGEWLVFSDADDYFYPGAFDVIDSYVTTHNLDIVYFLCDSRDGVTGELIRERVPHIRRGIEKKNYDLLRYRSYVPYGKVIHREIVETYKIRFEEIEVSNDVMFSTLIGYYARNVGTIDSALYCNTRNMGSLFYKQNPRRIKIRMEAAIRVNDFLYHHGIKQRYYPHDYTFFYFPNQPLNFVWAVFRCRYKGQTLKYAREVWHKIRRELRKKRACPET